MSQIRFLRRWLMIAMIGAILGMSSARGDEPAAPDRKQDKPPVNIFVNTPADLATFLKSLARPDFVILNGDDYARLLSKLNATTSPRPPGWVVESLEMSGKMNGELAELVMDASVSLSAEGAIWVPLRLDGQPLTKAVSDDVEIPVRVGEGGGWEVELTGKKKHRVRLGLTVPVRQNFDGRRLNLAIPESASTRFAIEVSERPSEASTGPSEPIVPRALEGNAARLEGDLTPRSKFALLWRGEESSGSFVPLLAVRGEVAVEVDSGRFQTRSSWSVRSIRGAARQLELKLDPDDEVLEVELDGQTPKARIERVGASNRVTIPLAEPLIVGQERRLILTTRRTTVAGASVRLPFHGVVFTDAREQSGSIGIARGASLWIMGTAGRGIRQIDPRTELPTDLRARPATELAYQFSEQPFDLTLVAEPSPPLIRAEARTTVTLEPKTARIDTFLEFRVVRGRPFEINLKLSPGLVVESVEPEGLAQAEPSSSTGKAGAGILTIRLASRLAEGGRFTIHVVGRQAIDPSHPTSIGLFQPVGAASAGGRIAVLADPSLTAEVDAESSDSLAFHTALQVTPADWPWPSGRSATPILWLRHDDGPAALPLRIKHHPRSFTDSTALAILVRRNEIDVQQTSELSVRFGLLEHVDLTIPAALEGRWSLEGPLTTRTDLGTTPEGNRQVRVRPSGDSSRAIRLEFRYRLPIPASRTPGEPHVITVPWIRLSNGSFVESKLSANVASEASVDLGASGEGWLVESDAGSESPDAIHLTSSGSVDSVGPLKIESRPRKLAVLPRLVVPRLGIRTIVNPLGVSRTVASFWTETNESSFSIGLPKGARLLRARVGGEGVVDVEEIPDQGGFRIAFPKRQVVSPVLVELEYLLPVEDARAFREPPRLLGDGIVEQTFWEVRIPWSRALVGIPSGWTDENQWYWGGYLWALRPRRSERELAGWIKEGTQRPSESMIDGTDSISDSHGYLFSRQGAPDRLEMNTASRVGLVAICSGIVLAVGAFLVLAWRPRRRSVAIAFLLIAILSALLLDFMLIVLVVQSAMLGMVLTALVALMHRAMERRRSVSAFFGEPGGRSNTAGSTPKPGSTLSRTVGAGSDDSTAIRIRPTEQPAPSPASDSGMLTIGSTASVSPAHGRPGVSDASEH